MRVFNRSARPASLSLGARPAGEETETETEGTGTEGEGWGGRMRWGGWGSGKGHLFPRVGGANVNSKAAEVGDVDVQVDDEKTSYIPRVGAHLGDANVYLESLGFVRDGLSLSFLFSFLFNADFFSPNFYPTFTIHATASHEHRNPPSHNNRHHPRAEHCVPENRRSAIYARQLAYDKRCPCEA